jgi:hypothetical protein
VSASCFTLGFELPRSRAAFISAHCLHTHHGRERGMQLSLPLPYPCHPCNPWLNPRFRHSTFDIRHFP